MARVHRRKLGDLRGAILDFTAALRIAPKSDRILLQRGSTYYQLQQFERAIEDLTQIADLPDADPSMLEAVYRWRGSAFYRIGDDENALHDFNEIMKILKLDALSDPCEYVGTFGLPD